MSLRTDALLDPKNTLVFFCFSSFFFFCSFVCLRNQMRKRDINKQYSPKEREQTYYLDIFEPPPTWRPHSHSNYYPPTHRSPLHHQPSLSEIVYQDYNDNHIGNDFCFLVYNFNEFLMQCIVGLC